MQVVARIRGGNAGDLGGRIQIGLIPIIIAQDFDGTVAFIRKVPRAPLTEPSAGGSFSVAIGSKYGLTYARLGNIIRKDVVHDPTDVLENVSPVHPFLVVSRRRGDGKVISLGSIPFRIDAIERKGLNCQHVRKNGSLRPGGVDFVAGHVFYVILVSDIVVRGGSVRGIAVMNNDILRNDDAA